MSSEDLPEIASSDVQSDEAEKALEALLRKPDFILRKDNPDYGVDYVAEVGVEGHASNVRFQIQLKSEARGSTSHDGATISVVLKVSALNYLHRGGGEKMLVVYDVESKTLYFEWVQRLVEALDLKNKGWRAQKTVTVHVPCENKLSSTAARSIHSRVLSLCHTAAEVAASPLVSVPLPDDKVKVVLEGSADHTKLLGILREAGTAFVAHGMGAKVLEALGAIPSSEWYTDVRMLLVAAYAHSQTGSPLQALYHANLLEAAAPTLNEDEVTLLEYIQLSARLDLGQLSVDSYFDGMDELSLKHPETVVGLQCGLEGIHRKMVYLAKDSGEPWPQLEVLLKDAVATFEKLKTKLGADAQVWSAELLVSQVEFEAADQQFMDNVFQIRTAEKLGHPFDVAKKVVLAERSFQLQSRATDRCERIYKEGCASDRPDMAALALLTGAQAHFKRYQLVGFLAPDVRAQREEKEGAKQLEIILKQASESLRLFKIRGKRQMSFRAARLCADVLNVLGKTKERDELIAFLTLEAKILGYNPSAVNLSSQHLEGIPPPAMDTPEAEEAFWATMSDEDVRGYALRILDVLGVPKIRLGNVLKDVQAQRQIHRERRTWCKHLDLLSDLKHTREKDTYYAVDPNRACLCKKLGYRTRVEDPDTRTIINAFKDTYCKKCAEREL